MAYSWEFVAQVFKTTAHYCGFSASPELLSMCKEAYEAADKEDRHSIMAALEPILEKYEAEFKRREAR